MPTNHHSPPACARCASGRGECLLCRATLSGGVGRCPVDRVFVLVRLGAVFCSLVSVMRTESLATVVVLAKGLRLTGDQHNQRPLLICGQRRQLLCQPGGEDAGRAMRAGSMLCGGLLDAACCVVWTMEQHAGLSEWMDDVVGPARSKVAQASGQMWCRQGTTTSNPDSGDAGVPQCAGPAFTVSGLGPRLGRL